MQNLFDFKYSDSRKNFFEFIDHTFNNILKNFDASILNNKNLSRLVRECADVIYSHIDSDKEFVFVKKTNSINEFVMSQPEIENYIIIENKNYKYVYRNNCNIIINNRVLDTRNYTSMSAYSNSYNNLSSSYANMSFENIEESLYRLSYDIGKGLANNVLCDKYVIYDVAHSLISNLNSLDQVLKIEYCKLPVLVEQYNYGIKSRAYSSGILGFNNSYGIKINTSNINLTNLIP